MHIVKKFALVAVVSAFLMGGLCACEKKAETPGEKLDNALDKASDALHDAGDAIKTK